MAKIKIHFHSPQLILYKLLKSFFNPSQFTASIKQLSFNLFEVVLITLIHILLYKEKIRLVDFTKTFLLKNKKMNPLLNSSFYFYQILYNQNKGR